MFTRFFIFSICLTLTITLHELGHYGMARIFHVRVRKFVIFLDFGFHLFSTHDKWFLRLFPSMMDKVDIRIGWLPLAAYVLFQASDKEHQSPSCFDLNPAWKRLLIWFCGPLANYVLYVAMFFVLVMHCNPHKPLTRNIGWTFRESTTFAINYVPRSTHNLIKYYSRKLGFEKTPAVSRKTKERGGWYNAVRSYPDKWQTYHVISNFMMLNFLFFLLNLVPVPPLDGGNLVYCTYEMIVRRPPNENLQIAITITGFFLVTAFSLWGIIDDLIHDFT